MAFLPKIDYLQLSNSLKLWPLETNIWKISKTCTKKTKATVNVNQVWGSLTSSSTCGLGYSTRKVNRFPGNVLNRLKHLGSTTLHFWQQKNKVLKSSRKVLKWDSGIFLRGYSLNNFFAKLDISKTVSILVCFFVKSFYFTQYWETRLKSRENIQGCCTAT